MIGFWALPILEEHGESGICVCVLVEVVWVVLGESVWAAWARVWEGGVVLCPCNNNNNIYLKSNIQCT